MIDTKTAVYFYDDRGKDKSPCYSVETLFEDSTVCLCRTCHNDIVLFKKEDGQVLTMNYEFWFATNEVPGTVTDEDGKVQWIFNGFGGKWVFERSSGHAGYRCQNCATWVYQYQPLKCNCNKF